MTETFKMFNTIIDKWTNKRNIFILETMNFLCSFFTYSLGSFIINMKLKLGDSKAKEIYSELIVQGKKHLKAMIVKLTLKYMRLHFLWW